LLQCSHPRRCHHRRGDPSQVSTGAEGGLLPLTPPTFAKTRGRPCPNAPHFLLFKHTPTPAGGVLPPSTPSTPKPAGCAATLVASQPPPHALPSTNAHIRTAAATSVGARQRRGRSLSAPLHPTTKPAAPPPPPWPHVPAPFEPAEARPIGRAAAPLPTNGCGGAGSGRRPLSVAKPFRYAVAPRAASSGPAPTPADTGRRGAARRRALDLPARLPSPPRPQRPRRGGASRGPARATEAPTGHRYILQGGRPSRSRRKRL